jgi:hypothetical protein
MCGSSGFCWLCSACLSPTPLHPIKVLFSAADMLNNSWRFVLFCLFALWPRVLLCGPGWLPVHYPFAALVLGFTAILLHAWLQWLLSSSVTMSQGGFRKEGSKDGREVRLFSTCDFYIYSQAKYSRSSHFSVRRKRKRIHTHISQLVIMFCWFPNASTYTVATVILWKCSSANSPY